MTHTGVVRICVFALAALALAGVSLGRAFRSGSAAGSPAPRQSQPDLAKPPVPNAALIEPEELARILQSRGGEKPLILQVGIRFLFKEAHIPGAEYIGPGSKDEGLRQLRQRVSSLPRSKPIVLYCGCCPWTRCPNVKPAYEALRSLGFTQVKVLHIDQNFGTNWVAKGYPTAKGE
jgi:rhodanese-related sulfurtransferase